MEENNKLTWEDIQKNINKPVWDYKRKKWRVIDGYKRFKNEETVSFTDTDSWIELEDLELYKEEK